MESVSVGLPEKVRSHTSVVLRRSQLITRLLPVAHHICLNFSGRSGAISSPMLIPHGGTPHLQRRPYYVAQLIQLDCSRSLIFDVFLRRACSYSRCFVQPWATRQPVPPNPRRRIYQSNFNSTLELEYSTKINRCFSNGAPLTGLNRLRGASCTPNRNLPAIEVRISVMPMVFEP
jgi:hypothetical protein